jgi:hypothetical protein
MSKNLMTPKGMMSLLYSHFDDVHQAAISHVVTDENGDHLYLALIRSSGDGGGGGLGKQHAGGAAPGHQHRPEKEHTATAAMPADPGAGPVGNVDDMDVSLSRHLVSLLHQPVMWDGCDSKQDHAATEDSNPATTVSHKDVEGIFHVMDRVSASGLKDEAVGHHEAK